MTDPKPRHTPEPWRVGGYGILGVHPLDAENPKRGHEIVAETSSANAARIVACVNALAGLEPKAVGKLVEFVEDLAGHGVRFDLKPTLMLKGEDDAQRLLSMNESYCRYLKRIDTDVRERATEALAALRRE